MIVPMTAAHAGQVLAVYAQGIAGGDATFETAAPDWAAFDAARLPQYRFVAINPDLSGKSGAEREGGSARKGEGDRTAEGAGDVVGWIACSAVSARPAYAGVVEHSVYVRADQAGRGVGRALLGALIEATEAAGIWTIQSGVFPENTASLALHERCGFRVIGVRERIGRHHGRWRDVVLLERRSPVVF